MNRGQRGGGTDPAVSTVGTVIALVVVVVLIVAAGVFVLGDSPGQPSTGTDGGTPTAGTDTESADAERTSFSADQRPLIYQDSGAGKGERNLTTALFFHEGGESLDVSQTRLSINGNTSTWRIDYRETSFDRVFPVPNVWETRDTNASVTFRPGNVWRVVAYSCNSCENPPMPAPENIDAGDGQPELWYYIAGDGYQGSGDDPLTFSPWSGGGGDQHDANVLQAGDDIQVRWSAASGSETETLFQYTVQ